MKPSNNRTRWRFELKVKDRRILADYVSFRRMSLAQLALRVHEKNPHIKGPSKATIGHLLTGTTNGTKPEWARAIEEVLDAPAGSLFVPKVSRVSEDAA
jgi:hypothetical protein